LCKDNKSILNYQIRKKQEDGRRLTGGLAQAGQWLARKFVRIWKFIARPSVSGSPAFAKPLGRYVQAVEN